MKKKLKGIIWGLVFIVAGIGFALDNLGVLDFNLFFDGWWTLLIIVPCLIGLFTEKDKTGNIIGLAIGVALLLCCQNLLDFDLIRKLIFPAIVLIIGITILCKAFSKTADSEKIKQLKEKDLRTANAIFSGVDIRPQGEAFHGAELTAVFGGIECDLRNAIFEEDCVINATAIFGGVDVFLPENVNVKSTSNSLFGGVSDKKHQNKEENGITVYVNGASVFGGVEIK